VVLAPYSPDYLKSQLKMSASRPDAAGELSLAEMINKRLPSITHSTSLNSSSDVIRCIASASPLFFDSFLHYPTSVTFFSESCMLIDAQTHKEMAMDRVSRDKEGANPTINLRPENVDEML